MRQATLKTTQKYALLKTKYKNYLYAILNRQDNFLHYLTFYLKTKQNF